MCDAMSQGCCTGRCAAALVSSGLLEVAMRATWQLGASLPSAECSGCVIALALFAWMTGFWITLWKLCQLQLLCAGRTVARHRQGNPVETC